MKKTPKTSEDFFQDKINAGTINKEDGDKAKEFIKTYGALRKLATGSRNKYYFVLAAFLTKVRERGKTLATLEEADAISLIEWLQNSRYSEHSRADYWDRFTRFYKWYAKREGAAWDVLVKDILIGEDKYVYRIDNNRVVKKSILTPEEMLRVIHLEPDLSYKVVFAVSYEGGLRPGELLGLRIGDVQKHPDGGYVMQLPISKTERRPVHIVDFAVHYVSKWLVFHPDKENLSAPLFLNTFGRPLRNETVNKHLKYIAKMAGLKKDKLTPSSLRHSRATAIANAGMSEFQMQKMFGWKVGKSRMAATYIRAESIDVRHAVQRAAGKDVEESKPKPAGRQCLHCEHPNPHDAEYCDNCTLPLDAKRLEEIKQKADGVRMEGLVERLVLEKWGGLKDEIIASIKASQEKK